MSLLVGLARSIYDDLVNAARIPLEGYRDIRYTAIQYRRGRVPTHYIVRTLATSAAALVLIGFLLFPLAWIFGASISPDGGSIYSTNSLQFFPANPTLDAYRWVIGSFYVPSHHLQISALGYEVFVNTPNWELTGVDCSKYGGCSDFADYLWNSVAVSTFTVLLAMSFIVPGAYALSRKSFIMRGKVLYLYVLFTQVGGGLGIAGLVALYAIFAKAGNFTDPMFGFKMIDNHVALATYYAATAVPFNTWLLKTYMDSIPTSYEEAAVVDGASPFRVVWEIIIPLSAPGLATVFIFTFLAGWTEFIVAQILLSTEHYTLPVGLYNLVGRYEVPWAQFSAFALTFASPIVILYMFSQRYIEGGLSFGGMEG